MDPRESTLRQAFLGAVKECRKIGYKPTRFVQMLNERGAGNTARALLSATNTSDGFTQLYLAKRLDLSVEAIVLRPEHRELFTPNELATARQRLRDMDYSAAWDDTGHATTDVLDRKEIVFNKRETSEDQKDSILPSIADAESLISRIRSVVGQPERNMEDVVKDLLVRLGHPDNLIVFQQGRIDLTLIDGSGKTAIVFEVKRSIGSGPERDRARRQAIDYACQTGAPLVVITDADRYEIYDRRRGLDFDAMLCGRFQLTQFDEASEAVLDLLKPYRG